MLWVVPLGIRLTMILVSAWISGCKLSEMFSSPRRGGTCMNTGCSRRSNPPRHWDPRMMLCWITLTSGCRQGLAGGCVQAGWAWKVNVSHQGNAERVMGRKWALPLPPSPSRGAVTHGKRKSQEEEQASRFLPILNPETKQAVRCKWAIVGPAARERVSVPSQEG